MLASLLVNKFVTVMSDGNELEEQIEKLKAEGYDELIVEEFEEFSSSTTKHPSFDSTA